MAPYHNLRAWKHSRKLAISVYRLSRLNKDPTLYPLWDQLRRAALSVELNIVEGYSLFTTPQFVRHLRIAFGSANEVVSLLEIANEAELLDSGTVIQLLKIARDSAANLFGLLRKFTPHPEGTT